MAKRYSLEELRERAITRDVSYDIQRLYRDELKAGNEEVRDVLRTGHVAEAVSWLKSIAPDEMEYGTLTRDQRIEQAAGHAAAAGYPLEIIAEEHNLSDLL